MMDKLKVALLLDSFEIPAWEFLMLEKIISLDFVSIDLVIINNANCKKTLTKKWSEAVYYLYESIDKKIFKPYPDALELKDANKILKNISVLKACPVNKDGLDYFLDEDLSKIKLCQIDVIINFGFRNLGGAILDAAKFGVWSCHFGDSDINGGGPPGFWEMINNWPETGSELKIESEDPNKEKIIYRSWSMSNRLSLAKNRNHCFWKTASFAPRKLKNLYHLKEADFLEEAIPQNKNSSGSLYSIPSNRRALWLLTGQLFKMLSHVIEKIFCIDQWFLMFDLNNAKPFYLADFKKIMPPKGAYWADPHIIYKDDKYYIFIEEYIYKTKKGHISLLEITKDGKIEKPVKLIDKDYHFSYPFVFEWEGAYYMVPETAENKTIELYECVEFPYKWKFKMNLMDKVQAYDTTLLYYKNKWWLFTCIVENQGAMPDELFLFYSDELFTDSWVPHPLNPVVSDVKNARSAGKIFEKGGKLYRPAQNCSKRYGYGFNINEISALDELNYKESTVNAVRPDWDVAIKATHTFNREDNLTIVDVFRKKLRYGN